MRRGFLSVVAGLLLLVSSLAAHGQEPSQQAEVIRRYAAPEARGAVSLAAGLSTRCSCATTRSGAKRERGRFRPE
jgi:hypothetical protein